MPCTIPARWRAAVLGLLCAAAGAAQAQTQTLRCGRDFAQYGDTKSIVEAKCGAPAARDSFCKPVGVAPNTFGGAQQATVCEPVEEWTYRPGTGQFITILQFREGVLHDIRYGPRM
ncbi:DUF2845 domain-containing protein [Pseudorhodoferax sp.]|uniref:DUF2845 domain-containing protein n=1 Tax=Pseudorhodoferax sp. TaxID=1993553 RepID=UPI0039E54FF7